MNSDILFIRTKRRNVFMGAVHAKKWAGVLKRSSIVIGAVLTKKRVRSAQEADTRPHPILRCKDGLINLARGGIAPDDLRLRLWYEDGRRKRIPVPEQIGRNPCDLRIAF